MVFGHRSAEADPFGNGGDLVVGKLAGGRHLEGLPLDGFDESAFVRLAGDDYRAAFTARKYGFADVEAEVAFLLFGAVALVAVFREDRADFFLEELELVSGGIWAGGKSSKRQQQRCGKGQDGGNMAGDRRHTHPRMVGGSASLHQTEMLAAVRVWVNESRYLVSF